MLRCTIRAIQLQSAVIPVLNSVGSKPDASREEAMKNHCAYCYGKFGLVRQRRAFKSFCSQQCVDHHTVWLQAQVRKRKGWLDCLWSASLSVVPYANERSSA